MVFDFVGILVYSNPWDLRFGSFDVPPGSFILGWVIGVMGGDGPLVLAISSCRPVDR